MEQELVVPEKEEEGLNGIEACGQGKEEESLDAAGPCGPKKVEVGSGWNRTFWPQECRSRIWMVQELVLPGR